MMFQTTAIAIFLASASAVTAGTPCYNNYDDLFPLNLGPDECLSNTVFQIIKERYLANKNNPELERNEPTDVNCKGKNAHHEFAMLTGQENGDAALQYIDDECKYALMEAAQTLPQKQGWGEIEGAGVDLPDYFAGNGFLNEETGNFQQDEAEFNGDTDAYIYIGTDVQKNDHYPTTEESYLAGVAIQTMVDTQKTQSFFAKPDGVKESCTTNAIMCCWHRDRQYFDGNGNCKPKDCANQNPSDNTDLCWTENEGNVLPLPGQAIENDIHCHGLAWSNDDSGLDMNTAARWNTLFYVSLEDHLKTRGYVESLAADPNLQVEQPMCGCLEDMAPVSRSDCSQAVGTAQYTVDFNDNGVLEVQADSQTFELSFEQCEGINYKENVGPSQYDPNVSLRNQSLKGKNNDLSAFLFKQYLEEGIGLDKLKLANNTLVGLTKIDEEGKVRANACKTAFEDKFDAAYE